VRCGGGATRGRQRSSEPCSDGGGATREVPWRRWLRISGSEFHGVAAGTLPTDPDEMVVDLALSLSLCVCVCVGVCVCHSFSL
jgi:hypothetical protein